MAGHQTGVIAGATGNNLHSGDFAKQAIGLLAKTVGTAPIHGQGIVKAFWLFVDFLEHVVLIVTQVTTVLGCFNSGDGPKHRLT